MTDSTDFQYCNRQNELDALARTWNLQFVGNDFTVVSPETWDLTETFMIRLLLLFFMVAGLGCNNVTFWTGAWEIFLNKYNFRKKWRRTQSAGSRSLCLVFQFKTKRNKDVDMAWAEQAGGELDIYCS